MSEEKSTPEKFRDPSDPMGFLIIPVFGVILVAVVILWLNQKKSEEEQSFFPVTGRITMNNKPLDGFFQINFYPADQSITPVASGIIQEDGTYELTAGPLGIKGAMPGEYRVSVEMLERNDESFRMQGTDPKKIKINPKDGGTVVPPNPDPPFEKLFSDPKKTPQRAIVGKTDNRIDIDLPVASKKPKKKSKAEDDKGNKADLGKNAPAAQTEESKKVDEPKSVDRSKDGEAADEKKSGEGDFKGKNVSKSDASEKDGRSDPSGSLNQPSAKKAESSSGK